MTFQQRLMIITALAAVIAMAVLARKPIATLTNAREPPPFGRMIAVWLVVVACALVVVGIVSDTLLRHVIQIAQCHHHDFTRSAG